MAAWATQSHIRDADRVKARSEQREPLLAFSDPLKGRRALAALDFYVHADLFMNPTAELADIVLPVASCFEREALRFGFEINADTTAHRSGCCEVSRITEADQSKPEWSPNSRRGP